MTVATCLANKIRERWDTPQNTKLSGPSMMKPLVVDQDHKDTISYGVEDAEKGIYWVKLKFSTKDIADQPLETALIFQEKLLDLFKYIKSQWISA